MKRIICTFMAMLITFCFTACGNSNKIAEPENPVELKFQFQEIKYESFVVPELKLDDYLSSDQRNETAEDELKELFIEELEFFNAKYPGLDLNVNLDNVYVYDVDGDFIVNLGGLENTMAAYIPIWDVFLLNTEYNGDDISRLHNLAHESVHKIYYDSNPKHKLGLELTLSKGKDKRIGSNVIFYEGETEKLTLDFLNSKYSEVVSDNEFDMTSSYTYVPYLCNILSKTTNLDLCYWKNDIKSFSEEFDKSVYIKTGKITGGTPTELLLYACDQSYYGDYTASMAAAWELVGVAISGTGHENDYISIFKSFDEKVCNNQLHNSNFEVYLNTLIN